MSDSKELVPAKPVDRFRQEIKLRQNMMAPLLPRNVSYEKFEAQVVSAVVQNPTLLECDRLSLYRACVQAAELGLSLNPTLGEGDILQVFDRKAGKPQAQFRPRYMGMMKLARMSGLIAKIEAHVVHENDHFLMEKGFDEKLEHRPAHGNRGEKIGAYCFWVLKDGTKQFEYMDAEQINAIKLRSSAKTKEGKMVGPWVTDEDEMWRKTVVRRASKYMPRATEDPFRTAVDLDNLYEAGHEVDIENGEVIDITDVTAEANEPLVEVYPGEPEPEPRKPAQRRARQQVDDLEERVMDQPAEITEVIPEEDDAGDVDWVDWCERSISVVEDYTPAQKNEWRRHHAGQIGEAELMEPGAARMLLAKLK